MTIGEQLGVMLGIIVAPNGDVWALDFEKDQVVYLPQGDPHRVKFFYRSTEGKPNKDSPCKLNGPFHLYRVFRAATGAYRAPTETPAGCCHQRHRLAWSAPVRCTH
jgi:hypothetical protein